MKAAKVTVEVNLQELEAHRERNGEALGEEDYQQLKKGPQGSKIDQLPTNMATGPKTSPS
jgi:hypothetical protein